MLTVKKIGVLTSGGDAPGMNAAIRSVTRAAIEDGIEVLGVRRGYNGLLTCDTVEFNRRSVSGIINRGGTILYTARSAEFKTQEGLQKAVDNCHKLRIDGLVVIGGDGSFRGAKDLSALGIPTVGVPGTIDNDIAYTDYTIGYDTACNIAMEAIDRIRDTSESHERCSIVEVMGRKAGYIALHTAIATGADAVIIPEYEHDIENIISMIRKKHQTGRANFIIVVAEGVPGGGKRILAEIQNTTNLEVRLTILGHIQRGGSPTLIDRLNATCMGSHAANLLKDGIGNRIVGIKNGKVYDVDIFEGLSMQKSIRSELYKMAKVMEK